MDPLLLVDFGSTFTKVSAVDADTGTLLSSAQHHTTIEDDVMGGYWRAREELIGLDPKFENAETVACSSAGGGLRIVVIGLEPELTTSAARQVALNSGGRIVAELSGRHGDHDRARLAALQVDMVLLVGGTDGGNRSALIDGARAIIASRQAAPVVVAGNIEVQNETGALLTRANVVWQSAPNVLPEIGRLDVQGAQSVIRETFIKHVIGGKQMSAGEEFGRMVALPTPDAVLEAVQLLSTGTEAVPGAGDLLAIDVGGATTDVYSALGRRGTNGSAMRFVPEAAAARSVEADLGMRWSADGILDGAARAGVTLKGLPGQLADAVRRRTDEPSFLPTTNEDVQDDIELSRLTVLTAITRHAGRERVVLTPQGAEFHRVGRDLRRVRRVVVTGGIFRAHEPSNFTDYIATGFEDFDRRRFLLPDHPRVTVDERYILAAAGLLSRRSPSAAMNLMRNHLPQLFVQEESR